MGDGEGGGGKGAEGGVFEESAQESRCNAVAPHTLTHKHASGPELTRSLRSRLRGGCTHSRSHCRASRTFESPSVLRSSLDEDEEMKTYSKGDGPRVIGSSKN